MSESFSSNTEKNNFKKKPRPELNWRESFLVPSSSLEAMERQRTLRIEVTSIQKKLANRFKRLKFSNDAAYQTWRRKTIDALHYRQAALRKLKAFLREQSAG